MTDGFDGPLVAARSRWWVWLSAAALAIMMVVGSLVFARPWETTRVSDGDESLGVDLGGLPQLINEENTRVRASTLPWVTIAVALPIRRANNDPISAAAMLRELQGAYLAQLWSNHPEGNLAQFSNSNPLIRLVLADTGPLGSAWQETVEQLQDLLANDRLIGVTGLGPSRDSTQELANSLAEQGIPMFTSIITAGTINAPGLVRVAPTNLNQASALIGYLESRAEWTNATDAAPLLAYLVSDASVSDDYTADLAESFRKVMPKDGPRRLRDEGVYDGSIPGAGNVLDRIIDRICTTEARVVFFAGRTADLESFVRRLGTRQCADRQPLILIAADSANTLTGLAQGGQPALWDPDRSQMEVVYTTLATPDSWSTGSNAIPPGSADRFGTCPNCYRTLFGGEPLIDGYAIIGHDAVLTADAAAENVADQEGSPEPPPRDAVPNGQYAITGSNAVAGASGWIYYGTSNEPFGVPLNKVIPVMRLAPDRTTSLIELRTGSGTPPGPPQ